MMVEVKVPEVGESVQEALIVQWYGKEGDWVAEGAVLFVIETDKVTLEVAAEASGVLHIVVPEGSSVAIGTVVAHLDGQAGAAPGAQPPAPPSPAATRIPTAEPLLQSAVVAVPGAAPAPVPPLPDDTGGAEVVAPAAPAPPDEVSAAATLDPASLSPAVRRLVRERGLDPEKIAGTGPGGRLTKGDVVLYLESAVPSGPKPGAVPTRVGPAGDPTTAAEAAPAKGTTPAPVPTPAGSAAAEPEQVRKPMSRIRLKIAEHLLAARQNTAMLTTFNEIDMSRVAELRRRYKDVYRERHGVALGFMSFFVKATVAALVEFPAVNSFIDGTDMVSHRHVHMGIAIGADKGLVVPVIRYADLLGFAEIERAIGDFVHKIKQNRLELSDLEGGTFTISNGGVYGSLLSTPILNAPQSGILGMHKIEDRPVVVDGAVVVRPMMYVALSYDHRAIDGREAVSFLKRIKECIEHPERIMLEV